ncbi:MAG: M48 family metallopeptidase [Fibrobacteres bacterium]|nr:M48 family metallopeptidase [Fibrobacterota bacterium]
MDPGLIRALFLSAFACGFLLESGLDLLNRREILRHPGLPERFTRAPFAGRFTPEGYARSRAYALERLAFGGWARLWSAAIGLGLLFSGCLPAFDHALARAFGDGLSRGVVFLAGVTAVPALLNLPFAAWSTFRIEGKYGFNTMTWGLFWRDTARELALSAALGLPLLYALMAFFRFAGARWWLWAFAFALLYQVFLLFLYPGFIAPLFNRFTPLAEGDLRRAILSLADRLRFPSAGIFVMDGSRRSLHSNAYFTGFGRFRRIVLFDTLLRRMEQDELVAVLAHEIGHYRLKHVRTMLLTQALLLGALLFAASVALRFPPLYQAFGFAAGPAGARTLADAFAGPPTAGLYLFMAVFSALGPLFAPLRNLLSRRHEYQADAFAVAATRDPDAMRSALIKLSEQNLSNLTPHPWYSAFHFSHPTLVERVLSIERAAATSD